MRDIVIDELSCGRSERIPDKYVTEDVLQEVARMYKDEECLRACAEDEIARLRATIEVLTNNAITWDKHEIVGDLVNMMAYFREPDPNKWADTEPIYDEVLDAVDVDLGRLIGDEHLKDFVRSKRNEWRVGIKNSYQLKKLPKLDDSPKLYEYLSEEETSSAVRVLIKLCSQYYDVGSTIEEYAPKLVESLHPRYLREN